MFSQTLFAAVCVYTYDRAATRERGSEAMGRSIGNLVHKFALLDDQWWILLVKCNAVGVLLAKLLKTMQRRPTMPWTRWKERVTTRRPLFQTVALAVSGICSTGRMSCSSASISLAFSRMAQIVCIQDTTQTQNDVFFLKKKLENKNNRLLTSSCEFGWFGHVVPEHGAAHLKQQSPGALGPTTCPIYWIHEKKYFSTTFFLNLFFANNFFFVFLLPSGHDGGGACPHKSASPFALRASFSWRNKKQLKNSRGRGELKQ